MGRQPVHRRPTAGAHAQMRLRWNAKALSDLERLRAFLAPVNSRAADQTVMALVRAAGRLSEQPRLGVRLEEFKPREVRRVLVGDYELRYELTPDALHILRLWHSREDR